MTLPAETSTAAPALPGRIWRSVLRRPLAVIALAYLVVVVTAAAAAPGLAPFDPTATDLDHTRSGPTALHLLGTDALGRDVLSRQMYGGQTTLLGVAEAVVALLLLGVSLGLAAGFAGGLADRAISRGVDVMLAIPVLITLLVVVAVVGNNQTIVMITFGVLGAPMLARVVRGATLAVRQELYVAAARVAGLPSFHIVTRHVLPRVAGPIIVQASLFAGSAILAETGLAYLGLGVQPPTPSWGGSVADASTLIDQHPWLLVPSGAVIAFTVLAFGLLGDAVRDATAERTVRTRVGRRRRTSTKRATEAEFPRDSTALLSLRDLSIAVPGSDGNPVTVVDGVDLDIERGETVGLVGESGCGKSITARAILGLLPAGGSVADGRVFFGGRDLTAMSPRQLRLLRGAEIALITQEPLANLDPMFTIGHQVDEIVRRHDPGTRRAVRGRTLRLLGEVNLPDPEGVVRRYPHQLSGGMAQRVAIAMALAGRPQLLIADEPTTALDVTVQAEILDLLRRLQRDTGMAILLISHDWGVVARLCRRACVMYAGQLVESADVEELFDRPRHPYTAGLLGSTPRRARPLSPLPTIGGTVPDPEHRPVGCHFADRCPLATSECRSAPVPLFHPEPAHLTRCLHHIEVSRDVPHAAGRPA